MTSTSAHQKKKKKTVVIALLEEPAANQSLFTLRLSFLVQASLSFPSFTDVATEAEEGQILTTAI